MLFPTEPSLQLQGFFSFVVVAFVFIGQRWRMNLLLSHNHKLLCMRVYCQEGVSGTWDTGGVSSLLTQSL